MFKAMEKMGHHFGDERAPTFPKRINFLQ